MNGRRPKVDQGLVPQLPKEVAAIIGQLGLPSPQGSVVHRFSAKGSGRAVSLSQDFVALSEPTYTKWEQFQEELSRVVAALQDVYQPGFYITEKPAVPQIATHKPRSVTVSAIRHTVRPDLTLEEQTAGAADRALSVRSTWKRLAEAGRDLGGAP